MKVVIAGTRTFVDKVMFEKGMAECPFASSIKTVLHGAATGADQLAGQWAAERGITVIAFPVTPLDWRTLGKKAGPLRNIRMIDQTDAYIGFWDGISPGTKQGIEYATKLLLPVYVYRIDKPEQGLEKYME
jgi:hypothetical protein